VRVLVLLPAFLVACATDRPAGDATAGEQIYTDNCESCHMVDGTGDSTNGYPSLVDEKPSTDETIDLVTNGEGDMPEFGSTLSEQEIMDVAAYVDATFVNP